MEYEHDPSKTAAYLQGRIDEYVKFSARDTIMRNVRSDRHARYARVPDGGACDFCKMLGSRGFVYHSEEKAGGDSFHGTSMDSYHPFCNCQIAVCFDPYMDEYRKNGIKVRRGYGDGQVTVPGRDGSDELRNVDIDELFERYKSMTANFGSGSSKYRDYSRAGFLTSEAMDKARKLLEGAATMDELEAADAEIMRMWQPGSHVGRNQSQWDELSALAKERKKSLEAIVKVSQGMHFGVSNAWLSQFENEQIWIEKRDGSVFHKEGTPRGVDLTKVDKTCLKGGKSRHTHTTIIGGTFGEDDIRTTVELKFSEHVVEGTITGERYKLTRLESASDELGQKLVNDYELESQRSLFEHMDEVFVRDKVYEQSDQYLTDEQFAEVESKVKVDQHKWLKKNAQKYGFAYE